MTIYGYILAMALTTYLIRVLPLTVFRRPIQSRFVRSLLHYVPYACLTAMTFPASLDAGKFRLSGAAALAAAVLTARKGKSLIAVALVSCVTIFIVERLMFAIC